MSRQFLLANQDRRDLVDSPRICMFLMVDQMAYPEEFRQWTRLCKIFPLRIGALTCSWIDQFFAGYHFGDD
jgi:hypothetical protein